MRPSLLSLAGAVAAIACLVSPAFSQEAVTSPTIAKIKEAGVLRVGMADSMPAQTKNPATDEWEGFNVDMAKNLAQSLEVKLEIVDQTWSTLIPSLMQVDYDICMVDMFRTPARAQTVVFTDSYMVVGNTWIVRSDIPTENWKDLDDPKFTVVSVAGTASVVQSERLLPKATKKTLVSESELAAYLEVAGGRADAHLSDDGQNLLYLKANPDAKLKILGQDAPIEATGYAYAIRPGDYHFLSFLNTWIAYNTTTGFIADRKNAWWHASGK